MGWKNTNFLSPLGHLYSTKIYQTLIAQVIYCELVIQNMNKPNFCFAWPIFREWLSLSSGQQARWYGILVVIMLKEFSTTWHVGPPNCSFP